MYSVPFSILAVELVVLLLVCVWLRRVLRRHQRSRLGLLDLVERVSLDIGRFGRVEADVAPLEPIAHIDGSELPILGHCKCSRPSQ